MILYSAVRVSAISEQRIAEILSQNVKMSLDFRRLKLNGNILICGGSGAGKTFYEVKATWLYIDEFHVLLNSEYSAKYLQQLWKKVRKQGGLCTGITQNVVDLLQNYTATTMLANSEFVALLKQANTDSSKMAEVIGVSDAQLRFVTNSQSGMGLLKCGNVVIPFDNQIGKDTSLYKLYNTNIHEKIAEQRAKENHVSVV